MFLENHYEIFITSDTVIYFIFFGYDNIDFILNNLRDGFYSKMIKKNNGELLLCSKCRILKPKTRKYFPIHTVNNGYKNYQYLRNVCKICWGMVARGKKPEDRKNRYCPKGDF